MYWDLCAYSYCFWFFPSTLMYFLDVVQGVRPTGFLKDYPSVPNSTWAWEDDATVGVWSLASDWLILMQVNVYCFVQILLMVYIGDDLAWRLLKSKMHSPRCLCSHINVLYSMHRILNELLLPLNPARFQFLPWTLSMNFGGPFPRKLGIIRFHSSQCSTKHSDLFLVL